MYTRPIVVTDELRARFFKRIQKWESCWLYTGSLDKDGYGMFSRGQRGRPYKAHRFAWTEANGPIPDGLFVCHHCDNPTCVNPAHLFLGTCRDNNADAVQKGRLVCPLDRRARGDRNGARLHPEKMARGERVHTCTITSAIVSEVRRQAAEGKRVVDIARDLAISYWAVWGVVKGRSWRHVA